MADDKDVAAGKRFSRDMRRIREARDVSIDEIHNETRIARTLIQSFEEGGLYDHPTFNRVYLRSFVRAYAKAVDMAPDGALAGLEAALDGTYGNDLAVEYLDAAPRSEKAEGASPSESSEQGGAADVKDEDADEVSEPPTAGGADGRGGIVGPPREMGASAESPSAESDAGGRKPSPEPPQAVDRSASDRSDEAADEPLAESEEEAASDEPNERGTRRESDQEAPTEAPSTDSGETEGDGDAPSWFEGDADEVSREGKPETGRVGGSSPGEDQPSTGQAGVPGGGPGSSGIVGEPTELGSGGAEPPASSEPASPGPSGPEHSRRRRGRESRWFSFNQREVLVAAIGVVVVLLVLVGLGFAFFSNGQNPEPRKSTADVDSTTVRSASTQPDTTAGQTTPDPPPRANVRLGETMHLTVVGDDRVEEIRIQRDDDLRRPYWIEEGEAEVYPFQRRITVENQLADARLYLEGYPYPKPAGDPNSRIVITRTDAEAFVDTLRGEAPVLSMTPDTIPKGQPSQAEGIRVDSTQ